MILLDAAVSWTVIIPIILAVAAATGFWALFSNNNRKLDPAKARNTDAQTEEVMANVEAKKVDTVIKLYNNAIELSDHLSSQLEAAGKREELLQIRINNLQMQYELKIGELQNQLEFERRERQKVQEEVVRLRQQVEEYRRSPGGGGPR